MIHKKKENIIIIGITMFFLIVIFLESVIGFVNDRNIKEKGILTVGKVIDYKLGYRGGISFVYVITINGKNIINRKPFIELVSNRPADFIGKSFPVLFLKDNPSENQILISRNSFTKYGVNYPDSLNWVVGFEK